jgi:integrase
MMLTAARPGELRLAKWEEFDLEARLWTVPEDRMKNRRHMKHDHITPLARQAVECLRELQTFTRHGGLLLPGLSGRKPITDMTLTLALRRTWSDYRIVPHGFRHFFSTQANESGKFRPDAIEAALAHKDPNSIRATYNQATYLSERKELAQWWADELESMRTGADIIPIRGKVA